MGGLGVGVLFARETPLNPLCISCLDEEVFVAARALCVCGA